MTPKTRDDYLDLVDQAIFEVEEIMRCAEDEGDPEDSEFSDMMPVFEDLSAGLKKLHGDLLQGRHVFGDGRDLPFMAPLDKWKSRIPFFYLLTVLNTVHKQGLPG